MPHLRVSEASAVLGVSDDTVRRWIDANGIATVRDSAGRLLIDGADVASWAGQRPAPPDPTGVAGSSRNRFAGIVTRVVVDGVMAQVELQSGPHRLVSLMSAEAAEELELAPGSLATAVVKATVVAIETSARGS